MPSPRAVVLLILTLILTACAASRPAWFEERCQRLGFAKGSPEFQSCIQRDLDWAKAQRARAGRTGGP